MGDTLLAGSSLLWSPLTAAALVAVAALFIWVALAPAAPRREVSDRLGGYLERTDALEDDELRRPFLSRVAGPGVRGLLRLLGSLTPQRNVETTRRDLLQAGNPYGLTPLDFFGLRVLSIAVLAGGYFFLLGGGQPGAMVLRNTAIAAAAGLLLPRFWLKARIRRRKHDVARALPDALDMLTIGVEAGLAFESAMLRVGERWDNALTHEFRRAVAEMRVGTAREEALRRMVERTGVPDLATFVAVLIQSTELGVSIAEVLHSQAAGMRVKRRQRAEELARQAGIKMTFPLVFLIFPALFTVILGPAVPRLMEFLQNMGG
jgi:tight adherence protein C